MVLENIRNLLSLHQQIKSESGMMKQKRLLSLLVCSLLLTNTSIVATPGFRLRQKSFLAPEVCANTNRLEAATSDELPDLETSPEPRPSIVSTSHSAVTYDKTSIEIAGRRLFFFSGEFHPFRLPSPQLWYDVLYKLKEAGFNTISIYTHWGLIAPAPDVIDTTGINDLGLVLDTAKDVGLLVNVRPGPYINAETTAGGLPGWTQRLPADLRTNDTAFADAWRPYIEALARIIEPRQLALDASGRDIDPKSGPVVFVQLENEHHETSKTAAYVQDLKDTFIRNGVDKVLYSYNDASWTSPDGSFKSIVELYGVDSYPQGFDCEDPDVWAPVVNTTGAALEMLNLSGPNVIWEFQAGSFDPYNGAGYNKCYNLTNARFARVFDHAWLVQDFKLISHYMAYGGTNWGNLAEPTVYTSYDYGAALSEDRQIREKLREYGLLAGFLRSSPDFVSSQSVSNGVNIGVTEQSSDVTVAHRQAGAAHWYIVRHSNSSSLAQTTFKLDVVVGNRELTIPANGTLLLDGRDSFIISTNHALPSGATLLYSTAGLSHASKIGNADAVVFHGNPRQSFEAMLRAPADQRIINVSTSSSSVRSTTSTSDDSVRLSWMTGQRSKYIAEVRYSCGGRAVFFLADTLAAYKTRPLTLEPAGTTDNIFGTGQAVLVSGGYHLANATVDGKTLHLMGQSSEEEVLDIFGPIEYATATFNGEAVPIRPADQLGMQNLSIPGPSKEASEWSPPKLSRWRFADSLPEIQKEFCDADWVVANHTVTNNPYFYAPGIDTDGVVLFASEYGFASGNTVWRGHFTATGNETGIKDLRLQGGSFFGGSVWLDDQFLGSVVGTHEASDGNITAPFPKGRLTAGSKHVLTVLHDSTGLEEDVGPKRLGSGNGNSDFLDPLPLGAQWPLQGAKSPRGILSYSFLNSPDTEIPLWKVRGKYGGESCPDRVRKCLNEGGLHAEVQGWHLPGFDASCWPTTASTDLRLPHPGVRFFLTNFALSIPPSHDLPLTLVLPRPPSMGGNTTSSPLPQHRILLYINGWQIGRYLFPQGPQYRFPLPTGLVNPRGNNTLAVAVWSLGAPSGSPDTTKGEMKIEINIEVAGRYRGDVAKSAVVQGPTWAELRT